MENLSNDLILYNSNIDKQFTDTSSCLNVEKPLWACYAKFIQWMTGWLLSNKWQIMNELLRELDNFRQFNSQFLIFLHISTNSSCNFLFKVSVTLSKSSASGNLKLQGTSNICAQICKFDKLIKPCQSSHVSVSLLHPARRGHDFISQW